MTTPSTTLRWRNYMRECPSPDNWIDLGWYFAVSAALQRRVWYGDFDYNPLFCNVYFILCGPPACGKGNVLRPIAKFFRSPQMRKHAADRSREPRAGEEMEMKVPLGPADGSYQAIMDEMTANTRTFRIDTEDEKGTYIHSSIALILDELNSMFKRHNDEVPKFLLNTYDCIPHEYKTKNKGKNILNRTCTAMLAGCTPATLVEAARYNIFDDGFVSRCVFAFEFAPKFYKFEFMASFDEQQKTDYQALQSHLDRLTGVYGQVTMAPEALEYLTKQFDTVDVPNLQKARSKMQVYLGRKAAHTKKLAALVHYARAFDNVVSLEDAIEARQLLDLLEPRMVAGFNSVGRNEQTPIYRDIVKRVLVAPNGMSLAELLVEFQSDVTLTELTEAINTLVLTCELKQTGDRYYAK